MARKVSSQFKNQPNVNDCFLIFNATVPPEITMSSLRRDHFLIEVDPTAQEIELSCSTNYATPTFKVEWRIGTSGEALFMKPVW